MAPVLTGGDDHSGLISGKGSTSLRYQQNEQNKVESILRIRYWKLAEIASHSGLEKANAWFSFAHFYAVSLFPFLPPFFLILRTFFFNICHGPALTHLIVSGKLLQQCRLAQKHIKASKGLMVAMDNHRFSHSIYQSVHLYVWIMFGLLDLVLVN